MFDFIRKHTKITMGLLFLLIVPSFILFGIDGYSKSQGKSPVVAKVDGQDIFQTEWDRAHLREVDKLKASMPSLDAKRDTLRWSDWCVTVFWPLQPRS